MAESMQGLKRSHRCAELSKANIGETVTVMGWVQKNRNKGGIVFVDLRDRSGLLQLIFVAYTSDFILDLHVNSLRRKDFWKSRHRC